MNINFEPCEGLTDFQKQLNTVVNSLQEGDVTQDDFDKIKKFVKKYWPKVPVGNRKSELIHTLSLLVGKVQHLKDIEKNQFFIDMQSMKRLPDDLFIKVLSYFNSSDGDSKSAKQLIASIFTSANVKTLLPAWFSTKITPLPLVFLENHFEKLMDYIDNHPDENISLNLKGMRLSYESLEKLLGSCKKLTFLSIDDDRLVALPELPKTLKVLNCSGCSSLVSLPRLPSILQILNCSWCYQLATLPELSNTKLQSLNCSWCDLAALPELPSTLQALNYASCKIAVLPKFPDMLKEIICKV